jgi:hypothetical protein
MTMHAPTRRRRRPGWRRATCGSCGIIPPYGQNLDPPRIRPHWGGGTREGTPGRSRGNPAGISRSRCLASSATPRTAEAPDGSADSRTSGGARRTAKAEAPEDVGGGAEGHRRCAAEALGEGEENKNGVVCGRLDMISGTRRQAALRPNLPGNSSDFKGRRGTFEKGFMNAESFTTCIGGGGSEPTCLARMRRPAAS